MGRVKAQNTGKVGINRCGCSLFGLDRVLILGDFQGTSRVPRLLPIPPTLSIGLVAA